MFQRIDACALPTSEALLAADASTPSQPQVSQEVLQGAAYRLRDLPTSEALLAADASTPSQPQVSQEVLQGAAYRLRDPE